MWSPSCLAKITKTKVSCNGALSQILFYSIRALASAYIIEKIPHFIRLKPKIHPH